MTKDEYDKKNKEITDRFEFEQRQLNMTYATTNNKIKVGDIVTDHLKTIKVNTIRLVRQTNSSYPACKYSDLPRS